MRRLLVLVVSAAIIAACASFVPDVGDLRPEATSGGDGTSGGPGTSGPNGDGGSIADPDASGSDGSATGDAASDAEDAGPKTWVVSVGPNDNDVFNPKNVTIRAGDEVRWVWISSGHTVVSSTGSFCAPNDTNCASAPEQNKGATYTRKFPTAGVFTYYCGPHQSDGMTGTIAVQ